MNKFKDLAEEMFVAGYTAGILFGVDRCSSICENPEYNNPSQLVIDMFSLLSTNPILLKAVVMSTYPTMYEELQKAFKPTDEDEVH